MYWKAIFGSGESTYVLVTVKEKNSGTNRTFTDPVVGIEALSTAWQAMTLKENMGTDAGYTVRSCRSRAAGTRVVTNCGERSTAGCRHCRDNPWMVSSPVINHTQEETCWQMVTVPDTPH